MGADRFLNFLFTPSWRFRTEVGRCRYKCTAVQLAELPRLFVVRNSNCDRGATSCYRARKAPGWNNPGRVTRPAMCYEVPLCLLDQSKFGLENGRIVTDHYQSLGWAAAFDLQYSRNGRLAPRIASQSPYSFACVCDHAPLLQDLNGLFKLTPIQVATRMSTLDGLILLLYIAHASRAILCQSVRQIAVRQR